MARILITSGPTRQYLDPVRYLTNASSGKMGAALCRAATDGGHEVVVISGPVRVEYRGAAEVVHVVSTEEMLAAGETWFPKCDGLIGAAAPCDYRPVRVADEKMAKTGRPLQLHLVETPDVVAALAANRRSNQWVVGFALETNDHHFRAITKAERKQCDLMVLNRPEAMNADRNDIEVLRRDGSIVARRSGSKLDCAGEIMAAIERELINGP